MSASISGEQWLPIDETIFANMKLPAIERIRALTGCGISDAIVILSDRYKKLRDQSPERFSCSDNEYWKDFYS